MKILAIRIKNLASLEGITHVDFCQEPLIDAGIFAITGPTGAGKSTLLDALCLALYNKSPRYRLAEGGIDIMDGKDSTIKQDDVRGMLRDGCADGFAEVDFVAVDGQHYRAKWSVRRARNKAEGNLQSSEMSLKNISVLPHQDIPGKKTALLEIIERLVGLNFEQFTRSVLLAQGDFTAFLKAGKDEKASLLEKLTGTAIFSEISKRVFENHREQQQTLQYLNGKRKDIPTLTHEETEALKEEQSKKEEAKKQLEQHLADINKAIHWQEHRLKLEEALQKAQQQHQQAQQQKDSESERAQYLLLVERVQPAATLINSQQQAQEQLVSKLKEIKALQQKLSLLEQQKIASDRDKLEAELQFTKAEASEMAARPLLDQAKRLDVQLEEIHSQMKEAKDALKAATIRQKKHTEQLLQSQKTSETLAQEIAKLLQWTTDHASKQSVAEQQSLILSKLRDAAELDQKIKDYTLCIQKAEQNAVTLQQQKASLEKEQETSLQNKQQLQEENNALQLILSATSLQKLEAEKQTLDTALEDIISATAHWKILYDEIKEKEKQQQSLTQFTNELQRQLEKQEAANQLLAIREAERTAALRSLDKARLISAENVELLRSQLEPGTACPVCGSTSHPYAEDHPAMNHLVQELEEDYNHADAAYTHQLKTSSEINEHFQQLKKNIETAESNIIALDKIIKDAEKTWHQFQIYKDSKHLAEDAIAEWLQQELQQCKDQQQQLQQKIKNYHQQKEKSEICQNKLAELDKQLNQIANNIKDILRAQQSLDEQQDKDQKELGQAQEKMDEIKESLSPYFTSSAWFAKWQNNPEAFTRKVRDFAKEWKSKSELLEMKNQEQKINNEKLKGLQEQVDEIENDRETKSQKLSLLLKQWEALSGKRKELFGGATVEDTETQLQKALLTARQLVEAKKKVADAKQTEITEKTAQLKQLHSDQEQLSERIVKLNERQQEWLSAFNRQYDEALTTPTLLKLLAHSEDWLTAERKTMRAIDDALTQTISVLKEREQALAEHLKQQVGDKNLVELTQLQMEIKAAIEENTKAFHDAGFKLKEDEKNRQQIKTLLEEIEKQSIIVEQWAKLNEVIGSADGKKFRQIAQEYTLDILLRYANIHLEALSKRYLLERIPNTLGLQVVDQDMGNELRTVFSLSGGESFLVSLALALGLASLSSSRMQVESLFIDEGFGSLDPATLHIAMDALERLHNQGRKVGVISHVQEMTERIPVQIRVSKLQNGKSKVDVVSV